MTSNDDINIKQWGVETVRLTVFVLEPSPIDVTWWERLLSEPPETRVSRPREGAHRDEGAFQKGKLVLNIAPLRIDWLYTIGANSSEQDLPILGPFSETELPFYEVMYKWLSMCPPIKRIALGAVLFQAASSRPAGYTQIANYLPHVQLDPDGMLDFVYQINRPRVSSTIPSLSINRLSKWSVGQIQRLHVELNSEGKVASSTPSHKAIHTCRLELDINTSQNFTKPIDKGNLLPLFKELTMLGEEIARKGDIK